MDFGLSEEQSLVVDTVRQFVETELYPLEGEVERSGCCPRELGQDIQDKVRQIGFYAPNIPSAFGGGGLDNLTFALLE
jgi:acyl-CoA dehydrogenase